MTNQRQPSTQPQQSIEDRKAQKLLERIERKLALQAKVSRDKAV